VANQSGKADTAFRDLNALLPGKVFVWTTGYDSVCKISMEKRKLAKPAAEFTKYDLQVSSLRPRRL
jgi:hypothetical protein